jgi:copper chaperone CopZ
MVQTIRLPIGGMSCAACAKAVEGAMGKLPGVASVSVLTNALRLRHFVS